MDGQSPVPREPIAALAARLRPVRVLVVGDLMLDRYIAGEVSRRDPDHGSDILTETGRHDCLGGAANVARNAAALGAEVALCGLIGADPEGERLRALLRESGISPESARVAPERPTTLKQRFSAPGHALLRADRETSAPLPPDIEAALLARCAASMDEFDAVILSDYAKGVLRGGLAGDIIGLARASGIPVLVDPKGADFVRYAGAAYLTPNQAEFTRAAGGLSPTELVTRLDLDGLVITRAEHGATLFDRTGTREFPTEPVAKPEATGAGDSFIAMLAVACASGMGIDDAVRLANHAGRLACLRPRTAAVTKADLAEDLAAAERPVDPLLAQVALWKAAGLRVGFTNGCFDLLHAGHVHLIEQARARCDRLIVAVNTDASVRRLKGPVRPIHRLDHRMRVLGALRSVDLVTAFDDTTPLRLIEAITPDLLVKGADYTVETVVGASHVLAHGGTVFLAELIEGLSTTAALGGGQPVD